MPRVRWLPLLLVLGTAMVWPDSAGAQGTGRARSAERHFAGAKAGVRPLTRAKLVSRRPVGQGINRPEFVTLRKPGGRLLRAVFKAKKNEAPELNRSGVLPGSQYLREVAAYRVSRAMKLPIVPPTTLRHLDGQLGSLQLFVKARPSPAPGTASRARLDRVSMEKLRIFDYVIGNDDRNDANVLFVDRGGRLHPIAIDNGMSFPLGHPSRVFPVGAREHAGPLTPQARAFIAGLSAPRIARAMAESGIERTAIVAALRRLERLKTDAAFLALTRPGPFGYQSTYDAIRRLLADPTQGLSDEILQRVDRVADAALRLAGATSP